MDFKEIVENIKNDAEIGRVEVEETTDSSMIAYLPSGFTSVQRALKTLSQMKKDWKIEIVEKGGKKIVSFEGQLGIVVDNKDWDDFISKKLINDGKVESGILVDLSNYLVEALKEASDNMFVKTVNRIEKAIMVLLTSRNVLIIDNQFATWEKLFGVNSYTVGMGVAIPYSNNIDKIKKSVSKLTRDISKYYDNSLGDMQIAAKTLESGVALNVIPVLREYPYLYGGKLNSVFKGTNMSFEAYVDRSLIITESVVVDNYDVVDTLEKEEDVRVVGNVIFPKDKYFSRTFFRSLRDAF